MTRALPGALLFEGELVAETNNVVTTMVGNGSLLRWDVVDASAVFAGQGVGDRRAIGRAGDRLRSLGVVLLIHEHGKSLIEIGSTSSWLGRFLFGSSSVRPRSLVRLARLARSLHIGG